jgi:hypothetical protein
MPDTHAAANPIDCDATRVRGTAGGVQLQFGRVASGVAVDRVGGGVGVGHGGEL